MIKKLSDVADVSIIFVFRDKAPEENPDGNVLAFSIRDLVSNWPLKSSNLTRAFVDERKLTTSANAGDILLPGRGQSFPARFYDGALGPILPAGQVYVIRSKDPNKILPEYLSWYLNRPSVQQMIKQNLTGTTIPALNKSVLANIQIEVPSHYAQRKIAELQNLFDARSAIRRQLLDLQGQELELIGAEIIKKYDA